MIANVKLSKKKFNEKTARGWARRHGYRITHMENANEDFIFWQDEPQYFEGKKTEQPLKEGVRALLAERNTNPFIEGAYPEEDPNGRRIRVKDNNGYIYTVRAKNLRQAKFIVSKNEKIPMMQLDAWYEKNGWNWDVGAVRQDVPMGGDMIYSMEDAKMVDEMERKVIKFLIENPEPDDDTVHQFAQQLGVEPDELEPIFYKLATKLALIKQGQVPDEQFNPEELKMGIEVELEHTDDEDIAKMIAKAHLMEIPDYYTRLKKMEDEAKVNTKEKYNITFEEGLNTYYD